MKASTMKTASIICRVLTAASGLAAALLFFFDFFVIKFTSGGYSLTGINMIFTSTQTIGGQSVGTYKSTWYLVAFILALITVLFSILSMLKKEGEIRFKGMKYAMAASGLLFAINLTVIFCSSDKKYLDVRVEPMNDTLAESLRNADTTRQLALTLVFILALVTFVLAVLSMFTTDYAEVLESNGAKLTIPQRIKNFFKDYKSEIKKIVWPSRDNVVKNVIVVLIMCVVVGIFIWLLDWGLASLLKFIFNIQ